MKRKTQKTVFAGALVLLFMITSGAAFSQCTEVVWPESPELRAKAEESKVLYEDAIKTGQLAELKKAIKPFNWMVENVPNHHISLYIQGIELFDKLATLEKNADKKKAYIDSLMIIYDLRIKTCGDEAKVFNRKALSFVKHNANAQPVETLAILDKAFEMNGNNILESTIVPYFHVVRLNFLNKKVSEDDVLTRYDKLIELVDAKIQDAQSKGKPVDKLQKMKEDLEQLLLNTITINCDIVRSKFVPKFKANPNDIDIARKIFTFMLKDKCTDDPVWLEAAEAVYNSGEKNCGLAKNLGIIHLSKENYDKAEKFLKEAQSICTEGSDKAEILLYLGSVEARKGNRSGAREFYRQAAAADAGTAKQAYEKIGDLYLNSFDVCKKLESRVTDRLVYLIAYDYYAKAGDSKKMAIAKDGFPSKEEIFTENIESGTKVTVGCWINEATTIRTRD
jgi:Flp pilus assembly protein TadD, contains TPR repeats